jgi:hypothetical protein
MPYQLAQSALTALKENVEGGYIYSTSQIKECKADFGPHLPCECKAYDESILLVP